MLDLLAFHKGRRADVGIDTIAPNSVETGGILRAGPRFRGGRAAAGPGAVSPLEKAPAAYQAGTGSSRDQVGLVPGAPRQRPGRPKTRAKVEFSRVKIKLSI